MKSMLMAFVATGIIAFGASILLEGSGYSSQEAAKGNAVRLDAAGE